MALRPEVLGLPLACHDSLKTVIAGPEDANVLIAYGGGVGAGHVVARGTGGRVVGAATEGFQPFYEQGAAGDVRPGQYRVFVRGQDIVGGLMGGAFERSAGDGGVYVARQRLFAPRSHEDGGALVGHGKGVAVGAQRLATDAADHGPGWAGRNDALDVRSMNGYPVARPDGDRGRPRHTHLRRRQAEHSSQYPQRDRHLNRSS